MLDPNFGHARYLVSGAAPYWMELQHEVVNAASAEILPLAINE